MNDPLRVGDRMIGDGAPVFLAAEIGINHNGSLDLAHRMIDAAASSGADGIKFQNFRARDFIATDELTYEYQSGGTAVRESQLEMFKRYEMQDGWLPELKQHCDEAGVVFFSTPTSPSGVTELVGVGAGLLKNGSDFLTNTGLIEVMARSGIPTVISTGMAMESEVRSAINAFERAGGDHLIILHCTSAYPTPPEEVHLRKMQTLRQLFKRPVGFSDHSEGVAAAAAATAMGACFIEKHFTLDKGLEGPDHRFSADPAEWSELRASVREVEALMGDAEIAPAQIEDKARREYRLSCVASRNLRKGEVLGESMVTFKRPASGLPPTRVGELLGRILRIDLAEGQIIQLSDLE